MKLWHGSGCRFAVDGLPVGRVAWGPDNTEHLQLLRGDQTYQLTPPVTVKVERLEKGVRVGFPAIGADFLTDQQGGQAICSTVDRYNAFARAQSTRAQSVPPHSEPQSTTCTRQKSGQESGQELSRQLDLGGL